MKLKKIPKKQKMITKNISFTGSQNKTIEDYYGYLKLEAGEDIITSEILPEMIMQFINTDTGFKKFIKQSSSKQIMQQPNHSEENDHQQAS